MENLNEKELNIIRKALQTQEEHNNKNIDTYNTMQWENIGDMQNMFANKESFEIFKNNALNNWKAENEEIENLIEKTFEY